MTPLAIGAAIGGIIGNNLFKMVASLIGDPNMTSGIQALMLLILTSATFVYILKKDEIITYNITKISLIILVGLTLGIIGSFLGIGGGPFNMSALFLLFSMSSKTAASNSLYIILFSQLLNFIWSVITHSIPNVEIPILLGMMLFGILGSEIGGKISCKIDDKLVIVLFKCAMVLIMLINIYNIVNSLAIYFLRNSSYA